MVGSTQKKIVKSILNFFLILFISFKFCLFPSRAYSKSLYKTLKKRLQKIEKELTRVEKAERLLFRMDITFEIKIKREDKPGLNQFFLNRDLKREIFEEFIKFNLKHLEKKRQELKKEKTQIRHLLKRIRRKRKRRKKKTYPRERVRLFLTLSSR